MDAPRVQELLHSGRSRAAGEVCRDAFGASPLHYAIVQADVLSFEAILTGHMLSLEHTDNNQQDEACDMVRDFATMHVVRSSHGSPDLFFAKRRIRCPNLTCQTLVGS